MITQKEKITPEETSSSRRPRRSKLDLEQAITSAAVEQIKAKGFSKAMITDIFRNAKIEPVVFYNRYKNLNEFYDEFTRNYENWLTDFLQNNDEKISTEVGYSNLIERLLSTLMGDEVMTELLRWELTENNDITERTLRMREQQAIDACRNLQTLHPDMDLTAISALLVGGIYYLVLRRNRGSIVGIDINHSEGKKRIINAIRTIAYQLFHTDLNEQLASGGMDAQMYRQSFEQACRKRVETDFRDHVESLTTARREADHARIAARLRAEGISDKIIASVLS